MATERELSEALSAARAKKAEGTTLKALVCAALDAAAAMRAVAEAEAGMEIIRAVATSLPVCGDRYPMDEAAADAMRFIGLTPDHVRQARAIVAAAERKEVMPSGQEAVSTEPIPPSDAAPLTGGPIPEAGAPAGWQLVPLKPTIDMEVAGDEKIIERLNDHSFAIKEPTPAVLCYQAMLAAAPSPQPPAPAEGGTDVAGLISRFEMIGRAFDDAGEPNPLHCSFSAMEDLADDALHALTAQAALVQKLSNACVTTARERDAGAAEIASLQWERKQLRGAAQQIQEQSDAQAAALAAKEAEIERLLDDYCHWLDARLARHEARASLAGKEPRG